MATMATCKGWSLSLHLQREMSNKPSCDNTRILLALLPKSPGCLSLRRSLRNNDFGPHLPDDSITKMALLDHSHQRSDPDSRVRFESRQLPKPSSWRLLPSPLHFVDGSASLNQRVRLHGHGPHGLQVHLQCLRLPDPRLASRLYLRALGRRLLPGPTSWRSTRDC